jgi:hypothetical protein
VREKNTNCRQYRVRLKKNVSGIYVLINLKTGKWASLGGKQNARIGVAEMKNVTKPGT